jgi:N-acetylmuramoyl-L-alanine amidase
MSKVKIGLDAGHGGSSSGTYSINTTKDKLYEKDHSLELTKMVGERLEKNGFPVYYTRKTDINPGNVSERAKMCFSEGCRYAVSIHFNGFEKESANGVEVFVPHAEKAGGIEVGYYNYLGKFFTRRAPFARANNYSNRNDIFDKKINTQTRKFDAATSAKKDYFGFIRTAWEAGFSYDQTSDHEMLCATDPRFPREPYRRSHRSAYRRHRGRSQCPFWCLYRLL